MGVVAARPSVFRAASADLNLTHQPRGTSDAASASLRTVTSTRKLGAVGFDVDVDVFCTSLGMGGGRMTAHGPRSVSGPESKERTGCSSSVRRNLCRGQPGSIRP